MRIWREGKEIHVRMGNAEVMFADTLTALISLAAVALIFGYTAAVIF